VALTLGLPLPAQSSVDQAKIAVSTCSIAVELFQSRYTRPDEMPFPLILADNLNNAGAILGSGLSAQNLPSLADLRIELEVDGVAIAASQSGPSFGDLLVPLCWLADYASELGQPLKSGDTVITGARIGALPIERGKTYHVHSSLGSVEFVTE
jgi:2-keto-4-pentenoate hydratase